MPSEPGHRQHTLHGMLAIRRNGEELDADRCEKKSIVRCAEHAARGTGTGTGWVHQTGTAFSMGWGRPTRVAKSARRDRDRGACKCTRARTLVESMCAYSIDRAQWRVQCAGVRVCQPTPTTQKKQPPVTIFKF